MSLSRVLCCAKNVGVENLTELEIIIFFSTYRLQIISMTITNKSQDIYERTVQYKDSLVVDTLCKWTFQSFRFFLSFPSCLVNKLRVVAHHVHRSYKYWNTRVCTCIPVKKRFDWNQWNFPRFCVDLGATSQNPLITKPTTSIEKTPTWQVFWGVNTDQILLIFSHPLDIISVYKLIHF